jgi:DNA-binding winged helix-turn-helix (wHTH) protein
MLQHSQADVDGISQQQRPSVDSPDATATRPWSSPTTSATAQSMVLAVSAMSFGPFHVVPSQRLLLEGDQPLRLGSRAFDILVALVERAGQLVSKDELRNIVWPGTFVEDGNLKVQVSALRRTLRDGECGNRYIATVAGRGYWFVAPVVRSSGLNAGPPRERHTEPSAKPTKYDSTVRMFRMLAQCRP